MTRHRNDSAGARGPRTQVLLALCTVGVVAFNFPLLMVWDSPSTLFGLPVLPVALFVVWAALIVALALVCERAPGRGPGEPVPVERPWPPADACAGMPELTPDEGLQDGQGGDRHHDRGA